MNNPAYLSQLAQSSKKKLLFYGGYWVYNRSFLIGIFTCLSLLIYLGFYFFPYSMEEIQKLRIEDIWLTVALYLLIYFIGITGFLISLHVAFSTDIEYAIAAQVFRKSDNKLDQIRRGNQQMIDLDHLKTFIPDNKHFKPSMIRLFHLVINEAKDRRFDSSTTLMIPHREDSYSEIDKVGLIQRIALQLGILGTFIGLIGAFNELNLGELKTSLDNISAALKYSFSTSIAGLIVAILLGGMLFFLRKKQEQYFQTMEQACSSLISLARNSINHDAYLSSMQTLGEAVNDNSRRADKLSKSIQLQTGVLQNGIGHLSNTKQEFDEFIHKLTEAEVAFMKKMEQIYNTLSPTNLSEQLRNSLALATNQYFTETKANYAKLNNLAEKTTENIGSMDKQLQKQVVFMEMNQKNQNEFIRRITANHVAEEIKKAFVETTNGTLQKINSDTARLSSNISSYTQAMNKHNEIIQKRHRKDDKIIIGAGILVIIVTIVLILLKIGVFTFITEQPIQPIN